MAEEKGQYLPFSCHNAIYHLCKKARKSTVHLENELHVWLNVSFVDLIKHSFYVVYEILQFCQIPLCIIGQKQYKQNQYQCLVDVRHIFSQNGLKKPIYWVIDVNTGVFLRETTKKEKLPNLSYHERKYNGLKASLWNILQISNQNNQDEPQNAQDLQNILVQHDLLAQTNVFYCIALSPQHEIPWVMGHTETTCAPICFFAYTKSDLSIGYAFRQPKKLNSQTMQMNIDEANVNEDEPEPDTLNRRCAVNVKMTGLLLAYSLGLCLQPEMSQLSTALSLCVGAIWLTCDEKNHIRHAFYKDSKCFTQTEIFCDDDNVKAWTSFFTFIKKRAASMKEEKAQILTPLIERLKPFAKTHVKSLWSRCYDQLKKSINTFKVFVYCNDDTVLHQLKVPIAGVFYTPKSKGIYLKMLANHTITALSAQSIVFINLAEYFNCHGKMFEPYIDDDMLWEVAQDWLPHDGRDSFSAWSHPELKHDIKKLKHHGKMFGESTINYLFHRSQRNADLILQLWTALVGYLMVHFTYDLSTQPHISLSKMSFDIVWLMYATQAGPFAHALENLHPYTVFKLRPWCKGGFSYSFKNVIQMGQPLNDTETAKSIREFDLTSAYGYSGMTMNAAKGFGITFCDEKKSRKTQRRYKTFEYKAVMYTIFKILYTENKKIKNVFSNFSPLGLVYIGKHALDLVIVLADNAIKLYQFDGHFCHGDYNRPNCPSLGKYANGKTRQECEQNTMQRDETILNWLVTINSFECTYEVFTDCCHPEYSHQNLDKAFYMFHPLKDMISGLNRLDGTIEKADLSEITFLAIVNGRVTRNQQEPFGPVFSTNDQCVTMTEGRFLLTSNYYRYLKYYFGFQITNIEWIIFYKIDEDLPKVFKTLVTMRKNSLPKSPKAAFLKSVVNYACGYFGLNQSKQSKLIARVAYKLPHRFNIFRDDVSPLDNFHQQTLMLIASHLSKNKSTKYICNTPLVLFVQIIEFGKQRLNQAIQCLQKHIRPTAIKILYSNVDNLIVALSEDNLYNALKCDSETAQNDFFKEWQTLCGKDPGMLKEEWCHTSNEPWQFVSPCKMFHVLQTNQDSSSHYKSSCFSSGLPTQEAFQIAMAVLNKQPIQVIQEKKIDKLTGTDTQLVTYKFH